MTGTPIDEQEITLQATTRHPYQEKVWRAEAHIAECGTPPCPLCVERRDAIAAIRATIYVLSLTDWDPCCAFHMTIGVFTTEDAAQLAAADHASQRYMWEVKTWERNGRDLEMRVDNDIVDVSYGIRAFQLDRPHFN